MTTSDTPPTPLLTGPDLLRSAGLALDGPAFWGRPPAASGPGVFVVELPAPQPKVSIDPAAVRAWLDRVPGLRLDGRRPTVAELQTRLASFWLPGQAILYIGSSSRSISSRLAGMYKTPLGERRPQAAGYWLKTLHDLNKARLWWATTPDAELYEDALLDQFLKVVGTLPFAVLVTPSGKHRQHGIAAPLHDDEAGKRFPKPTHVTVLPDALEPEAAEPRARASAAAPTYKPARKPAARKPAARKLDLAKAAPSAIETPRVRGGSRSAAAMAAAAVAAAAAAAAATHVTPEGLAALHAELEELTTYRRPEVIARIKSARELGDLSENADYEAARKEQSFLEGRVQQLEQMIKSAVLIDPSVSGTEVVLGSTVIVATDRHGEETFAIVGSAEADAAAGKISFTSPIGRALMGRRAGQSVRVQVPSGAVEYRVVRVR